MQASDLEIFNDMPFYFWVKSKDGVYLWGNTAINEFAGVPVAGKGDAELKWGANAEELRIADKEVWEKGAPDFTKEYVDRSTRGYASLNVCKFIDEFEGQRCVFGVSFVIEGDKGPGA